MNNQETPETVEQNLLGTIETEKQKIFSYLSTCPQGSPAVVMAPWINGIDTFAWSLQQMAPLSEWLAQQGRPQAVQLLQFMIRDLGTARQQYLAMYQGMIQTEIGCAAIWQGAVNFATYNILAATRYSNAVFQKWQTDYFDIMEQRCFYCQRFLGIPGGGYHYECARQLGLI